MSAPHLLLSAKAGLAATTPESTHINSGQNTILTAGGHASLATAKSLLATALESIRLFAKSEGSKLYAAAGKVDIQAQSDDLNIIADKVLQIISAKERIHLSAPKEVLLTVEDSYMAYRQGHIEFGTTGDFTVHAAHHHFVGPNSMPILRPMLPVEEKVVPYDDFCILRDEETGDPLANIEYRIEVDTGEIIQGITDSAGHTKLAATGHNPGKLTIYIAEPEDES